MCVRERGGGKRRERKRREMETDRHRERAHWDTILDYNLYLSSVFPQCALRESWRGKESSRSVPELPL